MFEKLILLQRNRRPVFGIWCILFAWRLGTALEVFHDIEKALPLLTRNRTTCLATNAMQISNSRRNAYPLDLFGQTIFPSDSYSCFFEPPLLKQETHSCSHSHYICPVKDEYIRIAMTGFENASSQICHTFKALEDNKSEPQTNLIIVGGSVTAGGAYAVGCLEGGSPAYDCAWQHPVVKYLQTRYHNNHSKLNVIDLSVPATSSCTLLHSLIPRLKSRNITLTSRDLLFYDYSVNDGTLFQNADQFQRLEQCMEGVLENLVHYSVDSLPPVVILLEYHPFKFLELKGQYAEPDTYTRIYHEVARKFHLPIISYRDLFWHPLFRGDLKQYPKVEYIVRYGWAANGSNMDNHPPWIVHDIYADVIAGALDFTDRLCNGKSNFNKTSMNRTVDSLMEISSDPWSCFRDSRSNILSTVLINQEATAVNSSFLTPEEISHLPYGWKLYQDRRGKPGWIVEEPADGNVKKHRNSATLTFSAPYRLTSSFSSSVSSISATLEITYMQTYQNAGAFHVKICDVLVPTYPDGYRNVDTLIDGHWSTLEAATFQVNLNSVMKHQICKKNGGLVVVKIIHEYITNRLETRGTQKVKITSVRLTVEKQFTKKKQSKPIPLNLRLAIGDDGAGRQLTVYFYLIIFVVSVVAICCFRRLSVQSVSFSLVVNHFTKNY
jgi:hypothetical protein